MQFKVPQFLDIEDKIFGPFTFRQFVYLAGGAGLCFVLFRLLGFWFGAIPIILVAGFVLALTFYKPNNKPFIFMVEAVVKYIFQDKLYVWKKRKNKVLPKTRSEKEVGLEIENRNESLYALSGGRLTGSKLRDLAWSLDVLDMKKEK
ncbi:hypothetical protein A3I95_00475 [Candidatus Nomurabacteria bacterium RIFCSPLOWO2_02_FULL_44_12]|uniref:PrgI family protein n=1 Tax=Candidatus Nomurabacteria bacterium RIFCSPLOWO2_12_FULL_44_11 TaxID=1801796 RepID=A0A1F6Y6M6_9BACT|nr:MAG: hypothetical protein A3E95_02795 [Candidatus Nomurabacteria bacterium RIFCSPHIGHO2_12_FULL_44_22b]OGJ01999.1 MAG: hypothetical protein A3G53_01800 [Candidatus Nomurabacteria bacterium RIFCSPLOWO2_12_FULL_44_11]OGJ08746.1 MAG: hypothetical protein A3I95_00475 [Candidatus Nomurabacteria bacterium RIFCSPLOWO2_02_FULL_44_12]